MGGKQTQTKNNSTETSSVGTSDVTGIDEYKRQFGQLYNQQNQAFKGLLGARPVLSTFGGFSTTPDTIVSNVMSKGVQDLNAADSAGARGLASQLSVAGTGNNGALLAALNRQSQIANAGNRNALVPMALQAQREFDLQKQDIMAKQNQEQMQNYMNNIQAWAQGNNLLGALNQMAGTAAGKRVTEKSSSKENGKVVSKKSFF